MGCTGSSYVANSAGEQVTGRSSFPPFIKTPFNNDEIAYADLMIRLASVLGDYERGRCDIREAKEVADKCMRSCAEIAAAVRIDDERTRVLIERRGLSVD